MAIPADILSIERPKNSFVIRTNKTEPARYAVRSRVGCKYVQGRRLPQNGPVIGHIDTEARIFCSSFTGVGKCFQYNISSKY